MQDRVISAAAENMKTLSSELLSPELDAGTAAGEEARRAAHVRIQQTKHAEFHALDLVLDLVHVGSPIIASDGGRTPGAPAGARLAHAWLADGRSLYDVLGPWMTLLVLVDHPVEDGVRTEDAVRSFGAPPTSEGCRCRSSSSLATTSPSGTAHASCSSARTSTSPGPAPTPPAIRPP